MQVLNKIIGKLVKLKENIFNMKLVLLQHSVQIQFVQGIESYSFLTSSRRIFSHYSKKTALALSETTAEG